MAGLEKIKSQILDEAKANADTRIREAEAKAAEILAEAEAEARKQAGDISRKSEADVAGYKERIQSAIDLKRRTGILAAKQEVIAEVLDKAYATLLGLESGEYFDLLLKILEKYALPQEGTICFSAADLKKMPADFPAKVTAAAEGKGGKLVISKEGIDIENGFVLIYGGIEENCTLKALFDAKKDDLSDKIHQLLFLA